MFTQCPKCQSVFMVSDKDTRAHEGLVRCGNCYSVFNSSWNLTDDPRSDFVGENVIPPEGGPSANQGAGFTFNLMGQNAAASHADPVKDTEGNDDLAQPASADTPVASADQHNNELEDFPEPDIGEDFHRITPAPKAKKEEESLLYFDSDKEEDELIELETKEEDRPVDIEDVTILQAPSFTSDIPSLNGDDFTELGSTDNESSLNSFSEENMWPGEDVSPEAAEDEITDGAAAPEADDGIKMLSDFTIDESLLGDEFGAESASDKVSKSAEADADTETLVSPQMPPYEDSSEDQAVAGEPQSDDPFADDLGDVFAGSLDAKGGVDKSSKADDTFLVSGQEAEADEQYSIESLPETTSEAFALDDEGVMPGDESVFITSEDEEIDEAYVPLSLKTAGEDEVLHGLDEFPEPGELSEMNYEDTMQINAMLEAANISKQQIESALSAAEVDEEDDGKAKKGGGADDNLDGESMLSHDADVDLTEALYPDDESSEEALAASDSGALQGNRSFLSAIKRLLPLGMGRKKKWQEPAILDSNETQLIQSLNRGEGSFMLPRWVKTYTMIASCGLLTLTLLTQIGYFYMDRLVRITPLRPVLLFACDIAGCRVPAIQNLQDIEQLSSRMTAMTGSDEGLKVSSILVNRSIRAQAYPAIELTLTDRAGNTISRRVVSQDTYLSESSSNVMKPNEAVNIDIRFRTPSIRVDGFELRAVSQNWLERTN